MKTMRVNSIRLLKKKFFLVFIFSFLSASSGYAQIGRSDWSYGPVFQSDNFIYNALFTGLQMIDEDGFVAENSWWIPSVRYRANIIQRMEFDSGKAEIYPKFWGFSSISTMDWTFRNFSAGYHLGWLSRVFPIGFDIQADYVQDGYKIKMPNSEDKQSIIKRMLSATALLRIRLLQYDTNRINPIIEIGGSYNYALHYHDDYIHDKDAVNNGFTGIIGLGFTNTETHMTWALRYEHSFYNYYNKDFIFNGAPIFSGAKSTFGKLGASLTYSF